MGQLNKPRKGRPIRGQCQECHRKKVALTKHSLVGKHRPPFKLVCRLCHDKFEGQNPPKQRKGKKPNKRLARGR